jgi:hypothetical protein
MTLSQASREPDPQKRGENLAQHVLETCFPPGVAEAYNVAFYLGQAMVWHVKSLPDKSANQVPVDGGIKEAGKPAVSPSGNKVA